MKTGPALALGIFLACATALPAQAMDIATTLSDEAQEKFEDDYGLRERDILASKLEQRIATALAGDAHNIHRIELVIEDAKPNRPTMKQMSDHPGLDFLSSISIGGASVTGTAFDESGAVVGELSYKWYESSLENVHAVAPWSDADSAFRKFSTRFAKALNSSAE